MEVSDAAMLASKSTVFIVLKNVKNTGYRYGLKIISKFEIPE
jgi:hypothetical protein